VEDCNRKECIALLTAPCTLELDSKSMKWTKQHFIDLAASLSKLHKVGIVHRDISPGNLGFYQDENYQLIPLLRDFGFATYIDVQHPYSGSVMTASYRVLNQLKSHKSLIEFKYDDLF
jgi:serine/threonine protein kinase